MLGVTCKPVMLIPYASVRCKPDMLNVVILSVVLLSVVAPVQTP
jgi:hypothetical protein